MTHLSPPINQLITEIAQNNLSGSTVLAQQALVALHQLLQEAPLAVSASLTTAQPLVVEFAQQVRQAQPKAAALFTLANRLLLILRQSADWTMARSNIEKTAQYFHKLLLNGPQNIASRITPLLHTHRTVLLHSHSGTVVQALLWVKKQGLDFQVICTESRPMQEGREVARTLAAAGIPVTLIVDTAVASLITEDTIFLIGADAVTSQGIINKIGSLMIALLAQHAQCLRYVLTDSSKFLPHEYLMDEEPHRPDAEVWDQPLPLGITIFNRYYEIVPWQLFTGLVTEQGIVSVKHAQDYLNTLEVAPELCAAPAF
jgi:translation initiation factor eIF-2B subunit delta